MDLGAKAPNESKENPSDMLDSLFSQMPYRSVDSKAMLEYLVFEIYQRAYVYLLKQLKAFIKDTHVSSKTETESAEIMVSLVDTASPMTAPINNDALVAQAGMTTGRLLSYAQLMQAYSSEKIRAIIIGKMFDETIAGYKKEGITLDLEGKLNPEDIEMGNHLDFFDLKSTSNVSFAVGEVACTPRGDDKAIADKIYASCKSKALKLSGQRAGDKSFKATAFMVAHSFGTYRYSTDNLCSITRASTLFDATMPGFFFLNASAVSLIKEGISDSQKKTYLATVARTHTLGRSASTVGQTQGVTPGR